MRFTTAPVVATAVAARRQQRRQRQSLSRARAKQQHPAATETAETNPRLDNIDNSTDIDRTRRDVELRPEGISPLARACGECYHSLSLITLALLVVVAVVVRALKAVFGPVARLCARANHDRSSSGRGQSVLDRDPRRVDDCEVGSATHTLSDPTRFVGGGVKAHCGQAPSGGGGKDSQRPYSVEGTLRVHPHPITNTQGKTTHSRDATAFEVVFEMFPPLTVLPACTTTISAAAACTRGEGSPDVALLLNPTGACKEMWLWTGTVQALLARGFFVVTLDTRGQGRSGAPPDGTPFDCCTVAREEVTQLLTLLGARAVHVLGYSVGAGVAMSLAIDHGQSRSSQSLVKASSTTASITAAAADFTDVVSSASAAVSRRDDPETSEAVLANPTHDDEDGDFGLASVCAFGFTSCYAECRTVAQAMAERALCSRWLVNLVGVAAHGVIIFVLCGYRPTPLDGVRRAIQAANDPGYYARALAAWG
jgi:pimeloyl-ACP methyl ester carboxylesterase